VSQPIVSVLTHEFIVKKVVIEGCKASNASDFKKCGESGGMSHF
jgi:hypothetical protein